MKLFLSKYVFCCVVMERSLAEPVLFVLYGLIQPLQGLGAVEESRKEKAEKIARYQTDR